MVLINRISYHGFQDEFQILVNGIALGLSEPKKLQFRRKMQACAKNVTEDDMIFNLEEEHVTDLSNNQSYSSQAVSNSHVRNQYLKETGSLKLKSRSPSRPLFRSLRLDKHVLTVPQPLQTSDKFYICAAPTITHFND